MRWPRSIRLQYSLRALAIFITLFMVWGGYHANRGWKQRAAEAILLRHEAAIYHGTGRIPHGFTDHVVDAYDGLVYALWGEGRVMEIDIKSSMEPKVVEALIALPRLDKLAIQPRPYTSDETSQMYRSGDFGKKLKPPASAMDRIMSNSEAKEMVLIACELSAADCEAIAACQSIESVNLMDCLLSDDGFAELLKLPRLRGLRMSHCQVTERGLSSVPGSTSLERISCVSTPVEKDFAAFVARSRNVTSLTVTHSGIDDEFVRNLGPHPSLIELGVHGGVITDQASADLEKMPCLERVGLPRDSLSDKTLARLKSTRPNLSVLQP